MWQAEVGTKCRTQIKKEWTKEGTHEPGTRNYKLEGRKKRKFTTLSLQANHDAQGRTQQMGTMQQQAEEDWA